MLRLLLAILISAPLVCTGASRNVELRVATAANFYPTLLKIKRSFEDITNHKLTIIRGSSGKLYAQIMQGAPYDIFFSADTARPDKLIKQGKTQDIDKENTSLIYALGRLVLWRPDADSSQQLREQLTNGDFKKLAIANPKTAPYGKASIQALKAMELYETVKPKLVYGENISQTLQFVQAGAADLGLVARSYVMHDIHWEIDSYLHKPVSQKVVILKQTRHLDIAREFLQFMQSPAIQKIITMDGYGH